MIGSVLRKVPAMTAPYSWLYGPRSVGSPSATGNLLSSVITTSGEIKSFQAVVKNSMLSTAITGVERGTRLSPSSWRFQDFLSPYPPDNELQGNGRTYIDLGLFRRRGAGGAREVEDAVFCRKGSC